MLTLALKKKTYAFCASENKNLAIRWETWWDTNNSSTFKLLDLKFSDNMSLNKYIEDVAKSAENKVGLFYRSREFLTSTSILYLYKPTIRMCMENFCHICAGAPTTSLFFYVTLWKRISNHLLPAKFELLSHSRGVVSFCFISISTECALMKNTPKQN